MGRGEGAVDERYVTLGGGGAPSSVTKRYKGVGGGGVSSFPEKALRNTWMAPNVLL